MKKEHRTTERMGISRDTVRDPPREYEKSGPEPQRALGPRGTQVMSDDARKAALEAQAAKVAQPAREVKIGVSRVGEVETDSRVDVGRVDPRRAPTQRGVPRAYQQPGNEVRRDSSLSNRPPPPSRRSLPMAIAWVLVTLLALSAILVGYLVLRGG
jgi:hypothetical protein